MTDMNQKQFASSVEERFAKRVTSLLNTSSHELSGDTQDRLREARLLAVNRAKPELVFVRSVQTAHPGNKNFSWEKPLWSLSSWLIPIAIVVFGLIAIAEWQEDQRIKDIANVDIALLTDDVPPDAFVDNGFMAYLKLKTSAKPQEAAPSEDEKI